MTNLYGAWVGGSTKGRIICAYGRTNSADDTQAIYTGNLLIETDQTTSDSVNSWTVSGDDGAHSGSNLGISFGSGGGTKVFYSFSFQKYGDGTITGKVSNIEALGGPDPIGTFVLDSGPLAPYFYDTNYSASAITATGFTVAGINGAPNGGTRNNIRAEYNKAANSTGSSIKTMGAYSSPVVTGLTPNTTYYFRVAISNNTYGWGAWGPWKSFKTLAGTPGAPDPNWYITAVGQSTVVLAALQCPNNGGLAIAGWEYQVEGSPNPNAAIQPTTDWGVITGLPSSTLLYFRVRAYNANGAGVWSDWKTATTQPGIQVKVGGVWKDAEAFVAITDNTTAPPTIVWKPAIRFINIAGVWKQ